MPRSCQPAGVPGPAQRTRCQSAASTARWGALSRALAPSPLRRVAGPARRGRVPASKHVVAGLVAGLRESAPDGRDPAESPGHKPPHSQLVPDKRASLPLSRQPRASQRNDLCMDLWTIWMNVQINHCIAVDARRCGKVDNRTAQSCQEAGLRCPRGMAAAAGGVAAHGRVIVLQRQAAPAGRGEPGKQDLAEPFPGITGDAELSRQ
jgi:hypothetical protein